MKEEEVPEALASYRDSLGVCSRQPARDRTHSLWPRRVAVGMAACAAVAVGVVAMWPQNAKAGSLHRLDLAIKNATTMEMTCTMERPVGNWWTLYHTYYKNGMWRLEVEKSPSQAVTEITRNGQTLTYYHRLDHGIISDSLGDPAAETKGEQNALEYAKGLIDRGQVSIDRTVSVHDHAPVNGAETYSIEMDRAADSYHAELVVDKATDLPIVGTVTLQQTSRLGPETVSFRQEYRFNASIPDSQFSFEIGKPVLRLDEARAALLREWSHPLASEKGTPVLDACVTPNGTIWIAVASKDSQVLPQTLTTPEGGEYVRGRDVNPGDPVSLGEVEMDGKRVSLVPFVSMDPQAVAPKTVTLQMAKREASWNYVADPTDKNESPVGEPIILHPRSEPDVRPGFFPALGLDRFGFEVGILAWFARAKQYESEKRFLDAAHAYESTAKAYRDFVKRGAYFPMTEAARCYKAAGRLEESAKAAQVAEEIRVKKER